MSEKHTSRDSIYMQRALDLANLGRGSVSPNPLVACVIVHQDRIIGEGWHQRYGEAHAEVNAVQSVADPSLLRESSVYVTLEPCSHYGKTPPCADMLIAQGVKKVIVSNVDPNPLVAGKGLEKLKKAGIEVEQGLLSAEGWELNKRFFTFFKEKRPYILLKWAETADGFIARTNYESKWISQALSRKLVHKWRSEEDAVMVGTNTAHYDDPQLNVRDWSGRNPVRIVIDRNLRLGPDLHLFDQKQATLCYNLQKDQSEENLTYIRLGEENFLEALIRDLYKRKIQSVLVEGGSFLLNQFLEKGYWDEARVFKSQNQVFGEGIRAPQTRGRMIAAEELLGDWYFEYRRI